MASSSAVIDLSRPTKSGITMCGYTTTSRSGRTGTRVADWALGDLLFSSGTVGSSGAGAPPCFRKDTSWGRPRRDTSRGPAGVSEGPDPLRCAGRHDFGVAGLQGVRPLRGISRGQSPWRPRSPARTGPSVRVRPRGAPDLRGGDLGLVAAIDEVGLAVAEDDGLVHDHLGDVLEGRQVVHDVEQDVLEDRPQAPRAGLAVHGLAGDGPQAVLAQLEVDVLHLEEPRILLRQRVAGLGQDRDQGFLVELLERRDHRQAADELRDQAELDEVLGLDVLEEVGALRPLGGHPHLGGKADAAARAPLFDDLLEAGEGAAADEEDVGRVDLQELLLRVLAAALRRHRGNRALDQLEQRLLHALARDVARDGRVVGLARDLVDLVDVDDAGLGLLDVVVALLQELLDDVLDVLADVARLGEGRRVGDREGGIEEARKGLRQQRLAAAGRPDQEDVALRGPDLVLFVPVALIAGPGLQALVVVVNGDREDLLGAVLPDHVFVEDLADLVRLR